MIICGPSKSEPPPQPATLTFFGPDPTRQIRAINPNGFEMARFMITGDKKSFTISRLTSPNTAPIQICTASKSSLSGTTTLLVHGNTELKFRDELVLTLETPTLGKLSWSDASLSSGVIKLKDKSKRVLAMATTKGDPNMQVLIQGDEVLLDCLLAGWVALLFRKNALEASASSAEAGLKVMEAVLTLGGGGA